jgi:hypothetical protein
MMKLLPLALAAAAALPAAAGDFGSGVDVSAFAAQARAQARSAAAAPGRPAPSPSALKPLPPISEGRRAVLVLRSSEWYARKDNMRLALDTLVDAVIAKGGDAAEWNGVRTRVWELAESIERQQLEVSRRVAARVASEETDPARRAERLAAADAVRDFRMFTLYGNLIPRVIDEAETDAQGRPVGRQDAGPGWSLAMTWEESQAVDRGLVAQTGISIDDYAAIGAAVSKEDRAAHPSTPVPGQPDEPVR